MRRREGRRKEIEIGKVKEEGKEEGVREKMEGRERGRGKER